jgi:hypothetical protein
MILDNTPGENYFDTVVDFCLSATTGVNINLNNYFLKFVLLPKVVFARLETCMLNNAIV